MILESPGASRCAIEGTTAREKSVNVIFDTHGSKLCVQIRGTLFVIDLVRNEESRHKSCPAGFRQLGV